MALIKCPKCGREISDKAKKCVGCGWKVKLGAINLKEEPTISDNSLQKEKLTNESVKAMTDQKQKELELEYKKREEFAQQREALEMAQQELERTKKEQMPELQRDVSVEKKKNLSNINILLFMVENILIMLCFMLIVWRKLDNFSTEIEYLASKNQTESEILVDDLEDNAEKKSDKNSDDMSEQDTTGSVNADNDITADEQTNMSNADENSNVSSETENSADNVVQIGNLEVDSSDHTGDGATYHLTDAAVLEVGEKDNTVKVTVKGEVTAASDYDRMGVYFKFLDNNGFELCEKLEFISGNVGTFTESFPDIPNTVACVSIK